MEQFFEFIAIGLDSHREQFCDGHDDLGPGPGIEIEKRLKILSRQDQKFNRRFGPRGHQSARFLDQSQLAEKFARPGESRNLLFLPRRPVRRRQI